MQAAVTHSMLSVYTHRAGVTPPRFDLCQTPPTALLLSAGPGLPIHQESAASEPSSSSSSCALKVPAHHRRSGTASEGLHAQHPTPASVHQLHRQQVPALPSVCRAIEVVPESD
jgi:hypothetical protein